MCDRSRYQWTTTEVAQDWGRDRVPKGTSEVVQRGFGTHGKGGPLGRSESKDTRGGCVLSHGPFTCTGKSQGDGRGEEGG